MLLSHVYLKSISGSYWLGELEGLTYTLEGNRGGRATVGEGHFYQEGVPSESLKVGDHGVLVFMPIELARYFGFVNEAGVEP